MKAGSAPISNDAAFSAGTEAASQAFVRPVEADRYNLNCSVGEAGFEEDHDAARLLLDTDGRVRNGVSRMSLAHFTPPAQERLYLQSSQCREAGHPDRPSLG